MGVTDVVADALTRIRNAIRAQHSSVEIPASKLKKSICEILLNEGYINKMYVYNDGKQGKIKVMLKYDAEKGSAIKSLRRVSKPGLRIYKSCEDMPKVMKGLGIAIVSTSKGIMTDRKARELHVGGEILAFVW